MSLEGPRSSKYHQAVTNLLHFTLLFHRTIANFKNDENEKKIEVK
jgi:hypothetical protein